MEILLLVAAADGGKNTGSCVDARGEHEDDSDGSEVEVTVVVVEEGVVEEGVEA